jgi:hypothetical protein
LEIIGPFFRVENGILLSPIHSPELLLTVPSGSNKSEAVRGVTAPSSVQEFGINHIDIVTIESEDAENEGFGGQGAALLRQLSPYCPDRRAPNL